MALTNTEVQRAYKARMYAAGYMQKTVWVLKESGGEPAGGMNRAGFMRRLDEVTADLGRRELSELYRELIKAAVLKKKEVRDKREKKKR
jgi:hypothetical protein